MIGLPTINATPALLNTANDSQQAKRAQPGNRLKVGDKTLSFHTRTDVWRYVSVICLFHALPARGVLVPRCAVNSKTTTCCFYPAPNMADT